MQDLQEALGEFMRAHGYSQLDAARALGVSQPSVSRVLTKGAGRLGPAARKIRQGILEAAPRSTKPQPEYSSIQVGGAGLKRITERLRALPEIEAVALDKMLAALDDFLEEWTGGDA
jgi:predicted transcriptional regulator